MPLPNETPVTAVLQKLNQPSLLNLATEDNLEILAVQVVNDYRGNTRIRYRLDRQVENPSIADDSADRFTEGRLYVNRARVGSDIVTEDPISLPVESLGTVAAAVEALNTKYSVQIDPAQIETIRNLVSRYELIPFKNSIAYNRGLIVGIATSDESPED